MIGMVTSLAGSLGSAVAGGAGTMGAGAAASGVGAGAAGSSLWSNAAKGFTGGGGGSSNMLGSVFSIIGAPMRALGAALMTPDKINVPNWIGIDPTKIEKETIAGNQKNLPAATKLAGDVSKANLQQTQRMLDYALPGGRKSAESAISDLLQGKLPSDMMSNLLRGGAARAMAGGFAGSGFGAGLSVRDLGLGSLQAFQMGMQGLNQLAGFYAGDQMDVQSMFFSTQQRASIGMWNAENQWSRDLMQAQIAAQPSKSKMQWGQALSIGGSAGS